VDKIRRQKSAKVFNTDLLAGPHSLGGYICQRCKACGTSRSSSVTIPTSIVPGIPAPTITSRNARNIPVIDPNPPLLQLEFCCCNVPMDRFKPQPLSWRQQNFSPPGSIAQLQIAICPAYRARIVRRTGGSGCTNPNFTRDIKDSLRRCCIDTNLSGSS